MSSGWEKDARLVGFSLAAAITNNEIDLLRLCMQSVQPIVLLRLSPIRPYLNTRLLERRRIKRADRKGPRTVVILSQHLQCSAIIQTGTPDDLGFL